MKRLASRLHFSNDHLFTAAVFTACCIVIFLRAPILFLEPRFWAEEGAIFFQDAYHATWLQTLTNTRLGYFNLWPSVSTWIAANFVSIMAAPLVTTVFALAAQVFPLLIILMSRSRLWRSRLAKILGCLIVLLMPASYESWINTVNSQFHFQLATILILLECAQTGIWKKWLYRVGLAAAGLTGMLSVILAPLFLLRWLTEKQREHLVQAAVLAACSLVQFVVILLFLNAGEGTAETRFSVEIGFRTTLSVLWTRALAPLFLGIETAERTLPFVYPLTENPTLRAAAPILLLVLETLFFWVVTRNFSWRERLLWLGAFFIPFLASVFFSIGSKPKYFIIYPGYSPRYFIIPSAVIMLMLLKNLLVERSKWAKMVFLAALCMALFWGGRSFLTHRPYDPAWSNWQQEVQLWQADPSYALRIWPEGWKVQLTPGRAPR